MPLKILKTSDMRGSKHKNTPKENRLEELGRVDAEKAWTRGGKRNLKDEKKRIVREITDPKRKEELRKKLQRVPTLPSRKLTDKQKQMIHKHFLKSGRPKIAKKGWRS